jgi:hypothetical protein
MVFFAEGGESMSEEVLEIFTVNNDGQACSPGDCSPTYPCSPDDCSPDDPD